MNNFWQTLKKPIMALAPMEDVTDTVFREVVLSVSSPEALHVIFTEFTSTDGLCSPAGKMKVIERLQVNASEKKLLKKQGAKLVAQIWGSDPEKFCQSARLISEMGHFDGIDINMGCPVKKVVKNKSCSALINHPELAKEIIQATISGTTLPVSVKTRIGFSSINTEEWIGHLLDTNPAAITIHGRTRKMMSNGPAIWEEIGKAVQLRNHLGSSTIILGNGSISSYNDALSRIHQYGTDGAMVGTGIFKDPWLFNPVRKEISIDRRIDLLLKHIILFEQTWKGEKNYNILKRFFKIYLSDFAGAAEWRSKLMHAANYEEAVRMVGELKRMKE
jgi:tRNA-dihydrouridine synthase